MTSAEYLDKFLASSIPSHAVKRNTTHGGLTLVPRVDFLQLNLSQDAGVVLRTLPVSTNSVNSKGFGSATLIGGVELNIFPGRFGRREVQLHFGGKQFRRIPLDWVATQQALGHLPAKLARVDWAIQTTRDALALYVFRAIDLGAVPHKPALIEGVNGATLQLALPCDGGVIVCYDAYDLDTLSWLVRLEIREKPGVLFGQYPWMAAPVRAVFGLGSAGFESVPVAFVAEPESPRKNYNRGLSLIAKFCPPDCHQIVKDFFEALDDSERLRLLEAAQQRRDREAVHYLAPWDRVTGEMLGSQEKK